MRAQIVAMTSENLDMDAIKRAGDILKAGGLVAFPTETVYGLGGNALDRSNDVIIRWKIMKQDFIWLRNL